MIRIDYNGTFVRTVQDHPELFVPHNLEKKVLHAIQHTTLTGHTTGQKLYYMIRKNITGHHSRCTVITRFAFVPIAQGIKRFTK